MLLFFFQSGDPSSSVRMSTRKPGNNSNKALSTLVIYNLHLSYENISIL